MIADIRTKSSHHEPKPRSSYSAPSYSPIAGTRTKPSRELGIVSDSSRHSTRSAIRNETTQSVSRVGFIDSPNYDSGTVSIYDNVTEASGPEHASDQIIYSQITSYEVGVAINPNPIRSKTPPIVPPRTKITHVETKQGNRPGPINHFSTKRADDDSRFRSGNNSKTDANSGLRSGSNSKTDVSGGLISEGYRSGNDSRTDLGGVLTSGSNSKRDVSSVRFSSDSARVFGLDGDDQSHGRRTWPGRARPPSIISPAPQPARSCEDNRFLHLNFSLLVDLKWFEKVCMIIYFIFLISVTYNNIVFPRFPCKILPYFIYYFDKEFQVPCLFFWPRCMQNLQRFKKNIFFIYLHYFSTIKFS